jgi:PAS domain S-box-containing protein
MENEISRVVDALPGLVWTALPDGHVEFLNQRWFEYTGLSVDEARGRGWQAAIHPEDLSELLERWQFSLASGEPREMEARVRRSDGEYRWFLVRICPLADASGQVVKWCGLNTDIDDRKRAEAMLAGENRLLELVASGRPLPIVLDSLCRLLDATAEGCSSSVLLLDRMRKRVQQVVAPGLPSGYGKSLEGGAVTCSEGPCGMALTLKKQVIVSDVVSDTRWDSQGWPALALAHGLKACWSTPILSLTGESLGTFAIYQSDGGSPTPFHQALIQRLTRIAGIAIERAQTDAELKRSEAFLAEAQRLSSTGSFSWRVGTDEFTWSEQLYRIYAFDPGVPVTHELIGTRDIRWANERTAWALNADGRDLEDDYQLQMPDGSVKHLHFVAHAVRDQDGQLEYTGAVQDVTQRRLSEQALAEARSELAHVAKVTSLGALAASIAHEVNQPLSGIITNASTCLRMLAADPPNADGARETARRTLRDANRASDVITRLRALFTKKGAANESVDLNEATREVIALSFSELQRNRVILRRELADGLPPVTGDRVQLQQVILNLLLNASEAMSGVHDRPRQLVIRTAWHEGDRVRLTVQDSGVGFEPQGVDRLFDAFYTTKSGGMGIGLSLSRSIIENHHGRLWAALNDGPGATFSFSLPREPEGVRGALSLGAIRMPAETDAQHVQVRNP